VHTNNFSFDKFCGKWRNSEDERIKKQRIYRIVGILKEEDVSSFKKDMRSVFVVFLEQVATTRCIR